MQSHLKPTSFLVLIGGLPVCQWPGVLNVEVLEFFIADKPLLCHCSPIVHINDIRGALWLRV